MPSVNIYQMRPFPWPMALENKVARGGARSLPKVTGFPFLVNTEHRTRPSSQWQELGAGSRKDPPTWPFLPVRGAGTGNQTLN